MNCFDIFRWNYLTFSHWMKCDCLFVCLIHFFYGYHGSHSRTSIIQPLFLWSGMALIKVTSRFSQYNAHTHTYKRARKSELRRVVCDERTRDRVRNKEMSLLKCQGISMLKWTLSTFLCHGRIHSKKSVPDKKYHHMT